MRVSVRRAALITAAVAAVAGCAPAAVAAPALAPSWHIVKRVPGGGTNGVFTAVTAVGRNGGWAFDGFSNATAWERNGSTWTQVPFPSQNNEMVVAAAATSATNAWAFTQEFGLSRALR